jgi:hypothetical protein
MSYIKQLYNQWLDFKHIRAIDPYLSDEHDKWLTIRDREKMIDCLFSYIRTETKPKVSYMDKKIKSIQKDTKKLAKKESSLLKADKKNDKVVDKAKMMKKKGC